MSSERDWRDRESFPSPESQEDAGARSLAAEVRTNPFRRAQYLRWKARKAAKAAKNPAAPVPRTTGQPLPDGSRRRMEPHLGADLSSVSIHVGAESAEAADQLGARAFTVGNDVYFGAGQFNPGTKEGDTLLAHELTHVVQGEAAGIQRKSDGEAAENPEADAHEHVSQPDEPAEKQADAVADQVGDELHGHRSDHGDAEPHATPAPAAVGKKISRKPTEAMPAPALVGGGRKISLKPRADQPAAPVGGGRKIFLQPHDAKQSEARPGKRDIDRKPSAGASEADWVHYLSELHRFLRDQAGAEKEQLLDIRANRDAHPIVGAVSEAAASVKAGEGVKIPDEGIWDQVFAHLDKAYALFATDKPDVDAAKREMATAVRLFEDAHRRVYEYRSRSEGGAQTAATTLRGVEIGCDITLTILSAGVGAGEVNLLKLGARGAFKLLAEQAGKSGLLKTAVKAAAVGAADKLAQGTAEEGTSRALGADGEFNVTRMLRDAGDAAVMNFLGVLVGGSLSKVFMRQLGEILGARMAPEALLALAEKYGVPGVIPPELFVSKGWRFLVGVAGDACTTTLLMALSTLVEQLRTGGKRPTGEQFVHMVVSQMIQNGLLQVIFAAVAHGKANTAAGRSGAVATGAGGGTAMTESASAGEKGASASAESVKPEPKSSTNEGEAGRDDKSNAQANELEPGKPHLTPEMLERRQVAYEFYKASGMRESAIEMHIGGIDLTKPVEVTTVKRGTILAQYQVPGAPQGNYYGELGTKPEKLGINPRGETRDSSGKITGVADKVPGRYIATADVPALRSTAKAVQDTWSIRGKPFEAEGGGTQYFTMEKVKLVPYRGEE